MQSSLQAFVAKQLGHPSGFCGRLLLRLLNRENAGMHQLAFEQLAIRQGDRILEIGFGGGSLLARILQTGLPERVVGVDYAEDALKVAQKKLRQYIQSGQLSLQQGNANHLSFPDQQFDHICTVNTLYFWPDAQTVFQECYRVLRPSGTVVVCYNTKDFLEEQGLIQQGFTGYDVETVEKLLSQAGFQSLQTLSGQDSSNGQYYCTCGKR
ncbi:class I SAM-dependent methyltransferase [Acaryochloris sp. CCMEE 5410]|uniref:class I SAM-dependent methyltransferase n=1 Tax=Acaryochloris sp. CCMEE 5410 TaxID=310037 RepID=UPI00024837F9|nr:class I SAM-dependent methyltransferase [Acaryochloris sp. CCMEE 5410]KAI9133595.1 class I SAM-dependent methyltransferase [Acaryochloris sp. CCMEE 5410]